MDLGYFYFDPQALREMASALCTAMPGQADDMRRIADLQDPLPRPSHPQEVQPIAAVDIEL